jgi:hypothetical protein
MCERRQVRVQARRQLHFLGDGGIKVSRARCHITLACNILTSDEYFASFLGSPCVLLPATCICIYSPTYMWKKWKTLLPSLPRYQVMYCILVQVKAKVTLRPTISRPDRLGVRRPSGTCDQFFFSLRFSFRQLLFIIL